MRSFHLRREGDAGGTNFQSCAPVTPVPVSVAVTGLPVAPVYVIVTVAVRVPDAVGVNVTPVLQLAKGLNWVGVIGQPELVMAKSPALVPPSTTLEMGKAVLPVFWNVMYWVGLGKPMVSVGKARAVSTSNAEVKDATP